MKFYSQPEFIIIMYIIYEGQDYYDNGKRFISLKV